MMTGLCKKHGTLLDQCAKCEDEAAKARISNPMIHDPAAPEPLGDSEGTATQVVAGLEPVELEYCGRCDKHTIPCDFDAVLYSAATVERMLAERDSFYMDYRMKCDVETKALHEQLAAAQAQIKQLREALDSAARILTFEGVPHYLLGFLEERDEALSLPQDNSALREWGARLLEEMADVLPDFHRMERHSVRDMLRRKADELRSKK